MKDTWCIENDFAAQRELAAAEEARGFREIEKLRYQLAESEARVKALEEALRNLLQRVRDDADAKYWFVTEQEAAEKALEVACQK